VITRARLLAENLSRVVAIALVAGLNVAGWTVMFSGAWRIGLWIVLLSAGIAGVVLVGRRRGLDARLVLRTCE